MGEKVSLPVNKMSRESQQDSQSFRQTRMIRLYCPKLFQGYSLPGCCHDNVVIDLNNSLCPLPSFFSLSYSCFVFLSVCSALPHVVSVAFPLAWLSFAPLLTSPCLVLFAKWHFTRRFLSLILFHFASCDSVKPLVKIASGYKLSLSRKEKAVRHRINRHNYHITGKADLNMNACKWTSTKSSSDFSLRVDIFTGCWHCVHLPTVSCQRKSIINS